MADAFFAQKIKTLFTRFDADKNGKIEGLNFILQKVSLNLYLFLYLIEVDDFHKWCETLANNGNLNAERTTALKNSLLKIWEVYFLPADANNDGSVEVDELVVYMKAVYLTKIILFSFKFFFT